MSGDNPPSDSQSDLPSDLPPEYAEAYRRGYERALREGPGAAGAAPPTAAGPPAERRTEPPVQQAPGSAEPSADSGEPTQAWSVEQYHGLHRASASEPTRAVERPAPDDRPVYAGYAARDDRPFLPGTGDPSRDADRQDGPDERRRKLLPPLVLVGLALLLVVTAYGLGRVFSSGVGEADATVEEPDGVTLSEDGAATPSQSAEGGPAKKPAPSTYRGPVDAVAVGSATASCQSDDSVDSAGRAVTYEPAKVYDGDLSTAWRCDGSGAGEQVSLALPEEVTVGEVGLVPGYAKTDPASGVDRYAENNRLTKVRWTFADGTSFVQTMSGSATDRDMRRMRIPRTTSDQVTLEILGSERGARNTVAISEVWIGAARA